MQRFIGSEFMTQSLKTIVEEEVRQYSMCVFQSIMKTSQCSIYKKRNKTKQNKQTNKQKNTPTNKKNKNKKTKKKTKTKTKTKTKKGNMLKTFAEDEVRQYSMCVMITSQCSIY